MENIGYLTAIGAALAWGSYIVPFKISKSERLFQFQAVMGVGILLSGLIFSLLAGYSLQINLYGLISGILWATANVIALIAILNLGMSKAIPIISSLVILSSFLWGVAIFSELPSGMVTGFVGVGLIVGGAVLVSTTGEALSQNVKKGLLAAVLAGLIFGSQLTPLKVGSVSTKDFFFSVCFGIFLTSLVIALANKVRFKNEAVRLSLLSGMIWNIGNLLSLISISLIGLSKGMPISQSATLIAVLWGLFYFKEITKSEQRRQVLIGAVILITGVITLGLA